MAGCSFWAPQTFTDSRGQLVLADLSAVPFPVERIFFICEVPAHQTRGNHALRNSVELLLTVNGSVIVTLDDGKKTKEVLLGHRDVGLIIGPNVWRVLSHFSAGAILAILASHSYDKANQIDSYSEFLALVTGNI